MDATLMNGATCTPGEGVVFDGVDDYVDLLDAEIEAKWPVAAGQVDALTEWSACSTTTVLQR